MTNKQFRLVFRWVHIIGAMIIGTYIYSPWGELTAFSSLVKCGVVPVLGISGIAMWMQRQPVIQRRLKAAESR